MDRKGGGRFPARASQSGQVRALARQKGRLYRSANEPVQCILPRPFRIFGISRGLASSGSLSLRHILELVPT